MYVDVAGAAGEMIDACRSGVRDLADLEAFGESVIDPRQKLSAIHEAFRGEYPTADMPQMLNEIEADDL